MNTVATKIFIIIVTMSLVLAFGKASWAQDRAAAEKLLEEGHYQRALEAYEGLMPKGDVSKNYALLMGLGKALFGLHEHNRSIGVFSRASGLKRKEFEPIYYLGLIAESRGQAYRQAKRESLAKNELRDAAIHFRHAAKLAPGNAQLHGAAARASMAILDYKAAIEDAKIALKLEPENPLRAMFLAGALYRAGELDEFLSLSANLIDKEAPNYDLCRFRLSALAQKERRADAEALFHFMLEEQNWPEAYEPYNILAQHWYRGTLATTKIRVLEEQRKRARSKALATFYLGLARVDVGDFKGAEKEFRAYIAEQDDNGNAYQYLSKTLCEQNRIAEAEAAALEALKRRPDLKAVRDQMEAMVLFAVQKQDFAHALVLHKNLFDLDPQNIAYQRNRAILLKENGRLEEAAQMLQKVAQNKNLNSELRATYLNDYALSLKGLGRLDEAIKVLEEAVDVSPFNPDCRENLAIFWLKLNKKEAAKALLLEVLKIASDDGEENSSKTWRARYYLGQIGRI